MFAASSEAMSTADNVGLIINLVVYVGLPLLVLSIGWLIGRVQEQRHLSSLARREAELSGIEVCDLRSPPGFAGAQGRCELVCGEVVIASDVFKRWLFALKNIVGGESRTFKVLFDRARREALLKMKERALELGCNAVCNVRYDSSDIGGNAGGTQKKSSAMAVVLVSGTAWRREEA
jgi:uncharacterized protein YbjQ (UPF0145 family)